MFGDTFSAVMFASLLACGVTTFGIYIISRHGEWGNKRSVYFMSFAAGVLISVSFVHIIPESLGMNRAAPMSLLAGFLTIYAVNRVLNMYVCHDYERTEYIVGIIAMLGIGLHSFVDGVIYSVAFNASMFTGVLAALGLILHEFPEGIVTFVLLKRGGLDTRESALYAFLAAGISTPLGALVSYPLIKTLEQTMLGVLLAFSAGVLVYVGSSHLLPAVERENKRYSVIALAAGVLVAMAIILTKGSS